jgi:hypothetical protein
MLKHEDQIANIFSKGDYWHWHKFRHLCLFSNEEQLSNYQGKLAKKLDLCEERETITLKTSGSTSNVMRQYQYPKKYFDLVDNHHMWRIFDSHGIKDGNVLQISQAHQMESDGLTGPHRYPSTGLQNKTFEIVYNPSKFNRKYWNLIFESSIPVMKPVFLYTTPSVFVSIREHIKDMDFPVIFSCETLTDEVRTEASKVFSKVIDKMRDWSTGFGFFECNKGSKHVYDELCAFRQDDGRVWVRDFFNYYDKSEKMSDDISFVSKRMCECGIYGNIIDVFDGKTFECLVSIGGVKYSANYLANGVLAKSKTTIKEYQIIQDEKKNVLIKTTSELTDQEALNIAKSINFMLMDHQSSDNLRNANVFKEDKALYVSSPQNPSITIEKSDHTLNGNKKISLRSFAK